MKSVKRNVLLLLSIGFGAPAAFAACSTERYGVLIEKAHVNGAFYLSPGDRLELENRAIAGDAAPDVRVGYYYLMFEYDRVKAKYWFRRGAELGDSRAEYMLGFLLSMESGMPGFREEALYWLSEAVIHGNEGAVERLRWLSL